MRNENLGTTGDVQSSEHIDRYLLVDRVMDASYEGSPVFDLDGNVVGIFASRQGEIGISSAIQVDSFKSVIADVFKDGINQVIIAVIDLKD